MFTARRVLHYGKRQNDQNKIVTNPVLMHKILDVVRRCFFVLNASGHPEYHGLVDYPLVGTELQRRIFSTL